MTENNVVDLIPKPPTGPQPPGTAYITLAGQSWPIPKLAVRQWRVVVPGVFKLMGNFGPMFEKMRQGDMTGVAAAQHFSLTQELTELMVEVIQAALSRATPRITKEHVLDMECDMTELMASLPVIMKQAGLFSAEPAQTRTASTSGEARTESPTGMV